MVKSRKKSKRYGTVPKVLRYAEFCTGVGGFRLGIEASKLPCRLVYSNEISESCEKTYVKNFNRAFDSHDLLSVNPDSLPDFDMMCAGFPCQPFSIAGKEQGFSDPRGNIFFKLLEFVKCKQPLVVFLENVKNLVRHNGGDTFKSIVESLKEAGYTVSHNILDSAYFGVPQNRERVYIVALRSDVFIQERVEFTERLTGRTAFRTFIDDSEDRGAVSERWNAYIDLYQGKTTKEKISFAIPRTKVKLERVAKGCDLNDCILQSRSSGVRALSLDDPFPTLAVQNSGGGAHIPILSKQRRHLSLLEMKRIMGFPESYDFSAVSRTDAAKQLGNAVCPPVIASICNDIYKCICSVVR